jgi:hypothetical protein
MGGNNKKRKHALFHASREAKQRQPEPTLAGNDELAAKNADSVAAEISEEDLRITVRTLQKLSGKRLSGVSTNTQTGYGATMGPRLRCNCRCCHKNEAVDSYFARRWE